MKDISNALTQLMCEYDCSSTCAALILLSDSNREEKDGICKFQSEPIKETSWGLRNSGNLKSD